MVKERKFPPTPIAYKERVEKFKESRRSILHQWKPKEINAKVPDVEIPDIEIDYIV